MAKTVNTETKDVSIGMNHSAHATHVGELMPEAIVNATISLLDKKDDVELGPLDVKFMLDDLADEDKFDWNDFPKIGSKIGAGVNNPHYFDYTNDRNRTVQGDFFWFAFCGTDKGAELLAKVKDCELAKSKEHSHQSKIYAAQVGNTLFLEDELRMLKARIKSGAAIWTKAASIHQKEMEFNDKIDPKKCKLSYFEVEDGNGEKVLKRTNQPFVIGDPSKLGTYKRLPISSFIELDLDEAVKNGGTYQAVAATLNTGASDPTRAKYKINSVDDVFAMLASIGLFLDPLDETGRKHQEAMRKRMDGASGEANLLSYGNAVHALDASWGEYEAPYDKLSADTRKKMRDANGENRKTA